MNLPADSYERLPGADPFGGATRSSIAVAAFRELREMVLNSVASEHSKRNYAKALDEVFALCEDRVSSRYLAPS